VRCTACPPVHHCSLPLDSRISSAGSSGLASFHGRTSPTLLVQGEPESIRVNHASEPRPLTAAAQQTDRRYTVGPCCRCASSQFAGGTQHNTCIHAYVCGLHCGVTRECVRSRHSHLVNCEFVYVVSNSRWRSLRLCRTACRRINQTVS
jgi:hypothetical protein